MKRVVMLVAIAALVVGIGVYSRRVPATAPVGSARGPASTPVRSEASERPFDGDFKAAMERDTQAAGSSASE